jgi:hypothetical protein
VLSHGVHSFFSEKGLIRAGNIRGFARGETRRSALTESDDELRLTSFPVRDYRKNVAGTYTLNARAWQATHSIQLPATS